MSCLEVSDRIAVIYRGRLSPPTAAAAADLEQIGLLMTGVGFAAGAEPAAGAGAGP